MVVAPSRRILVTGASSGIGAATAARLRGEGAEVIPLDVAGEPGTICCDLGKPEDIERAATAIAGRLDGIAHVAGLPGTYPAERVFAVNFLGLRLLTRRLEEKLNPGGAIAIVSSVASQRCDWSSDALAALANATWAEALALVAASSGADAYDLSKRMLAYSLPAMAAHFAATNVRVNIVSPGPVETPILADFRATMGAERLDGAARMTGRHGRPEEIAHAIAFVLDPSSSWINGIDLRVDGGLFALRAAAAAYV